MISFPINNTMFMQPQSTPESAWLGHIPFAGWLIEVMRPGILVELGTHRGASYLAFCQAIQRCAVQTKCYAVDTWEGDDHAGEYSEEVFFTLLDYHQRNYADFSRLMRMRFEEAVQYFDDGTVDLLHIDGLHTYEAVRGDFETWKSKLSRRAVVLFHDINVRERDFGVWRYWAEMRERYPSFEFTHTHGLGVLLVGPEQPEALQQLCQAGDLDEGAVLINRMFDNGGRLISANVDIGTVAREQGRLAGLLNQSEAAHSLLSAENAVLRDERDALQTKLGEQEGVYSVELARSSELSELVARTADLPAAVEQLLAEIAAIRALVEAKDLEIHRLNEVAQRDRVELERMRSSFSWRLMAPFRALRGGA
ncbi:class I SAM-dependent methyltransferase [Xanthomonas citri pv. citri]|uniref:class I SAM-dependent methyltransferase n=1 Tax=Xanthomonas citri TaxID=346 RepID=UPI0036DD76EE